MGSYTSKIIATLRIVWKGKQALASSPFPICTWIVVLLFCSQYSRSSLAGMTLYCPDLKEKIRCRSNSQKYESMIYGGEIISIASVKSVPSRLAEAVLYQERGAGRKLFVCSQSSNHSG
jgi:hypothetical protein